MDLSNNRFDQPLLDGIKHKVKLNITASSAHAAVASRDMAACFARHNGMAS